MIIQLDTEQIKTLSPMAREMLFLILRHSDKDGKLDRGMSFLQDKLHCGRTAAWGAKDELVSCGLVQQYQPNNPFAPISLSFVGKVNTTANTGVNTTVNTMTPEKRDKDKAFAKPSEHYGEHRSEHYGEHGEKERSKERDLPFQETKINNQETGNRNIIYTFRPPTENPDLLAAWKAFEEMRKRLRTPLTEYAGKLAWGKVCQYAKTDEERIAVIEQSIEKGWKGIFPLKNDPPRAAAPQTTADTAPKRKAPLRNNAQTPSSSSSNMFRPFWEVEEESKADDTKPIYAIDVVNANEKVDDSYFKMFGE